jgi:hypothetical protein
MTPENRRMSRISTPEAHTNAVVTPSKVVRENKDYSSSQLKIYSEFTTPPSVSEYSRKESSKLGHGTRSTLTPKSRSAPSKSSRTQNDVFARLTQGLPTRHTAPPTNEHALPKRSRSTGRMKSRRDSKGHQPNTTSSAKHLTVSPHVASQSLLRHSDSDPQDKISRVSQALHEKETSPRTLTSQLLLPSPPRDFISCVPEPPDQTIIQADRSDYKSYLQHLRDLIDGKSEEIKSSHRLSSRRSPGIQ